MKWKSALALALAGLWASAASATIITFDLTRDPGRGSDNVQSVSLEEDGLNLLIQESPTRAEIDWDENGVGVQNCGWFGCESEQLDGNGIDEALYFAFSDVVRLISVTFSLVGYDDDATVAGGGLNLGGDIPSSGYVNLAGFNMWDDLFRFGVLGSDDDYKLASITVETSVPEPGSLALLGAGLLAIGFGRRRLRRG